MVVGWNTVSLRYLNLYNTNRVGLHSYVDSSDNEQYLYSQFESFHCFRVFPVFDQPDLKAKMTLTVTCPEDWSAVGNAIEQRFKFHEGSRVLERHNIRSFKDFYDDENKVAITSFEQTSKISCYLYAICAGNYKVYEDYDPMHTP